MGPGLRRDFTGPCQRVWLCSLEGGNGIQAASAATEPLCELLPGLDSVTPTLVHTPGALGSTLRPAHAAWEAIWCVQTQPEEQERVTAVASEVPPLFSWHGSSVYASPSLAAG